MSSHETGPEGDQERRKGHLRLVTDPESGATANIKKFPYSPGRLKARRERKENRVKLKRLFGAGLGAAVLAFTTVGELKPIEGAKRVNAGAGNVPGKVFDAVTGTNEEANELTKRQQEVVDNGNRIKILRQEAVEHEIPVRVQP